MNWYMPEEVEQEAIKGNLSAQIAVLASVIKSFEKSNNEAHEKIVKAIEELSKHVNHENEGIREEISLLKKEKIDSLEKEIEGLKDCNKQRDAQRKGEVKVYKTLATILGIALTVVTILKTLGLF
jgi:hypothetical protein